MFIILVNKLCLTQAQLKKMKLLLLLCLVAAAAAQRYAQITQYDNYNDGLGRYNFRYQQDDGQYRDEQGELKNAGRDDEAQSVRGSYGWTGPDNVQYKVNYVADEDGFQPTIEQGPGGGVPPAVVASLLG